ncbi:MAG: nucleotidyltransferase [Parvularcula sp.]|jgi:hypothetical protein|nr:nucleotidyltransferase [Parvularcula sp.]
MLHQPYQQFKRSALVSALEAVCEDLEPTYTQTDEARTRYEGAGKWLAEGSHPALAGVLIYVQGSIAIGTAVKPIGRLEFDVDLIARLTGAAGSYSPAFIKAMVGERLKEHGVYDRLIEEMCRCWRLNYANQFHLDITPSVPNPHCPNGGELVPDRELRTWKASNPQGYRDLFAKRAALVPRLRLVKGLTIDEQARAGVEPFPEHAGFKGILRRIVQIAKRHRDVYFQRRPSERPPISVILTTLLARSYEQCVTTRVYEDEFELLIDVIGRMPNFIEHRPGFWAIWNETTEGENFAEKWNSDPNRATSFFAWHRKLLDDLDALQTIEGLDLMAKKLEDGLGDRPAKVAVSRIEDAVATARKAGVLQLGATGLTAAPTTAAAPAIKIPRNTFFGRAP